MNKLHSISAAILAALLAAALFALPAGAQGLPGTVRVVMDDNYPPFSFKDSSGRQQGILIDQWKLWEQKTGIRVEINAMDWGKAVTGMKRGEYDVIDTLFKTDERSEWLDFSKPYATIEVPIFFDKEIGGITDAASLKGFVVADKRGDAMIDLLERSGVGNLLLFDNFDALIQAAKEHKVNVFVMGRPPALYFLNKYGIADRFRQSAPLHVNHFFRAVTKGNRELLDTVEDGFGRISPDEMEKIDQKWRGTSLGGSFPATSILAGVGALSLLLLVLMAWNRTLKKAVVKRTLELQRSEESLQLTSFTVEHVADSVFWITAEASIIGVNEAACRQLGYARDELLKLKIGDIDTHYNADIWPQHWNELKTRGSLFFATNQVAKDGKIIPVEITANFIRFNDREYNCAFVRDISDRKRAEEALREREERLRVIFEASDSGIILVTPRGIIDFANRRMAEMFGMSYQELIGSTYSEHLHESEKTIGDERMRQIVRGEIRSVAYERHYIRKDGSGFWGHLSGRRLENPDGSLQALVGVISDITEYKQMTRQLAESEVRLRTLVQTIPDLIWLKDVNGVYLSCNTIFERFFGARESEIIGKTDYDFVDRELADFFRSHDRTAMAAGKPSCNEEWVTFADDGHRALLETIKTPMYDADGELIGVLGIAREITDRKKSEEERINLERRLLHSQKLESLGILSGGIAHDFNNLLQALLGNLDLALMRLPVDAPGRKNIDQAVKAGRHAAGLTNMMLAYSGKGVFVIKPLNLTELVEENAAMLDAAIPKSITLEQHLEHSLPTIRADAGQIQQVIMNLITNASEAIGNAGGTITLTTGAGIFDQAVLNRSRLDDKPAAGRYVWLEVRDNGCGMDEDTLHKLFDPFFTTKFTGRGLGMSAVLGIIRAHKGAFLVESSPAGGGTTIQVLFPSDVGQPAGPDPDSEGGPAPEEQIDRPVTVLVVDDEDMIRDVSTAMLKELGYETLAAASGEEALEIFRREGDSIDVVLLDQVMPGMDGVSVFNELRRIRPDITVLLASGFSLQEVSERFRGLGLNGFLAKPYTMKSLTSELSLALHGRR